MKKFVTPKQLQHIIGFGKKYAPELETGAGIAMMLSGVVLGIKATTKASRILEEKRLLEGEPDKKEIVKSVWKEYIPCFISCIAGVGFIALAGSQNYKRKAALSTAYALSDVALKEYKEKTLSLFGEEKMKEIQDSISSDKVSKSKIENVQIVGTSECLCMDGLTGRQFVSSAYKILEAESQVNEALGRYEYVSLNEFYNKLGLDGGMLGEDLGWNLEDGLLKIEFSSVVDEKSGMPVLVISYNIAPKYNYYSYTR